MSFLSTVASRFPPLNNQLRTSSNLKNQETIKNRRVTIQQVQRRHTQSFAGTRNKGIVTNSRGTTQQTEDLDAYDSDCDDISSAEEVLMENLPSCDSDVLYETNKMVNKSLSAELERYKERVAIFEQRQNVDLKKHKQLIDSQMDDLIRNRNLKFAAFQQEIDTLKETLSNQVKEKESLSTTLTIFKTKSKEKESKYIDKEIVLENQNKELENIICNLYRSTQAMHMLTKPQVFYDNTHKQALGYQNSFHLKKAQQTKQTLYNGSVIAKEHDVISVIDDEETLILEEEI
uniref:Uncharacterized protein n=1 Tax=Tanacetum cinerariifolium TaxID=118510 RepID=A0A699HD80_TANCI|nr:hypothetical protein [Tanacetum cinerariifolium]